MNPNIQALRAVAALWVALHHAFPHYIAMGGHSPALVAAGKLGFAGVDIFFVISGFVVALTTTDKPRGKASAVRFIRNRAARIYLGYWPFLALMFAINFSYSPATLPSTPLLQSVLLLEPKDHRNILPVAWSLTYELYFYALFIPLLWCPTQRLAHYVLAVFLLILFRNLCIPLKPFSPIRFFTSPFLLEFCAGALLYYYRAFFLKRQHGMIALMGIAGGFAVGVHYGFTSGPKRVYSFGIAACCLVWLFLLLGTHPLCRAPKPWARMGDASYTLYLCHLPLLDLFAFTGLRDFLSRQPALVIELSFLLLILGIMGFSMACHAWLEAPLYRRLRQDPS